MDGERPEMSDTEQNGGEYRKCNKGNDMEENPDGRQYDQGEGASNDSKEAEDGDNSEAEHSMEQDHQTDGRIEDSMTPGDHENPYEASDTGDDSSDSIRNLVEAHCYGKGMTGQVL